MAAGLAFSYYSTRESQSKAKADAPKQNMQLRMELVVADVHKSVRFYKDVLEFDAPDLAAEDYTPVTRGTVEFGLVPRTSLPKDHYFNQHGLQTSCPGLGVEVVLIVDDVEATFKHVQATCPDAIAEGLVDRPWGLADFRLKDPDGYYLRINEDF